MGIPIARDYLYVINRIVGTQNRIVGTQYQYDCTGPAGVPVVMLSIPNSYQCFTDANHIDILPSPN